MEFFQYVISEILQIYSGIYIVHIKPKDGDPITPFSPGQYIHVKNPAYKKSQETRIFSIASSPNNQNYIELCIKPYGEWTKQFVSLHPGDTIEVARPRGSFIWNNERNAVFLVGGIGIAPIISMLRFIREGNYNGNYLLLYGNRTSETVAYKDKLEGFMKSIKTLKTVHIFSDLLQADRRDEYAGFITEDIIKKEVNFSLHPIFFIVGPLIFIEKMKIILERLSIPTKEIKLESV